MTPEEFLADAASRGPDRVVKISIQALLDIWGYASRGPGAVAQIGAALAEAGLTTVPYFDDVPDMRQQVSVVLKASEPAPGPSQTEPGPPPSGEGTDADLESSFPPVSLCVGEIPSACRGVESVGIADSLQYAQTLMMRHDYSQLAVLDGSVLRGAVTWESISAAKISGIGPELRHAMMSEMPEVLHPRDKLLDKIPEISRNGFAFVVDHDALAGIITTADLSHQFAQLAGPFLLISEIERRVRRQIDKVCSLEDIKSAGSFNPTKPLTGLESVHGLTFGQCRQVLSNADIWKRLGWDIEQSVFLADLKVVKDTRNEVMHFRPEPLSDRQLATLEKFAKWLRRLDPLP
ncbi:hypothetical protein ACGFNU_08030 [Spirillospora sp. NPDC048911]|uniref:hypothetical protein n=1 Tax=Spirillospora sp. NPDC048911 TaxID=3364527 RepID=UPI00371D246D